MTMHYKEIKKAFEIQISDNMVYQVKNPVLFYMVENNEKVELKTVRIDVLKTLCSTLEGFKNIDVSSRVPRFKKTDV